MKSLSVRPLIVCVHASDVDFPGKEDIWVGGRSAEHRLETGSIG